MAYEPTLRLRNAIAGCDSCRSDGTTPIDRGQLCAPHRAVYNVELCNDRAALVDEESSTQHLNDLVAITATGTDGRELLGSFRRQARALDEVWEAYRRGAAQLPDSVAANVERALVKTTKVLSGPRVKD